MLNRRGGIECDFTVTRLAEERFRIVTGTAFGQHDLAWIREHAPRRTSRSTTSPRRYACLGLWGPRAREILQPLTTTPLDFPLHARRELAVGPCRAWRSASPTSASSAGSSTARPSSALALWDALWEAGRDARPRRRRLPGDRLAAAREGLPRLGRRHHARRHPLRGRPRLRREARQGRLPRPRRAARRAREPERRLGCLVLDDPRSVALGSEPVRVDGAVVGRVTSGGYGYTVERSIAYAYLPAAARDGRQPVEVEIFGEWIGGEVAAEPLFDPAGERIRA